MMANYTLLNNEIILPNVRFVRIEPTNLTLTLQEIMNSLADISWISKFDKKYMRDSFTVRASATVDNLTSKIVMGGNGKIESDAGEYVVSELSRQSLIQELNYADIPLAEVIKQQASGNPGFDFYSINLDEILLFGEAKYNSSQNAYGSALKQVDRFIVERRDTSDIVDVRDFCTDKVLDNFANDKKGYIVAFASKTTTTEKIITTIKRNKNFKKIVPMSSDLICIAVNI